MHVGVDIGATKTLLAVTGPDGNELDRRQFPTPAGFRDFIPRLLQTLDSVTVSGQVTAVVVAAPGIIEQDRMHRGGRLDWQDVDIVQPLQQNYPVAAIEVINDAAAGGLYEARAGAGKKYNVVLYVTISTGIGTGIIIDQQLLHNFGGSEGGQIVMDGHTGEKFEDIASGRAFTSRYHNLGEDETDPQAWKEYGAKVGTGLYSMICLIRPDIVIIGGSMGMHVSKFSNSMHERIRQLNGDFLPLPKITAATDPESAVVSGCLLRARELGNG